MTNKRHLRGITVYDSEEKSCKCLEKEQSHPAKGVTGNPVVILSKM